MTDDYDERPKYHVSANTLTYFLVAVTALIAGGIGWVGWNCIDSVQKNSGKLQNYNATPENTKIDSHHYDVVKTQIDAKVENNELTPSQDLQNLLVKMEGSEVCFSDGIGATDKKHYAEAIADFTKCLNLIPEEAKRKSSWYVYGCTTYRQTFVMWCLRQRGFCQLQMGHYAQALADLNEAMKTRPDSPEAYRFRARAYEGLGKHNLAEADKKTAAQLLATHPRRILP